MMDRATRSYDLLWLGIALFPLLMIAALLPVTPHDYWWYLRLGRETLAAGVPVVDTFSSIQAGQPIVYQSWLAAVFLWLVYKTGGIFLTFLLVIVLIGLIHAMLWMMMREAGIGPRLATLLTLLAGLSGSNNWGVRPQLFAYPLFLAVLWIILKWHKRESKTPWLLIPIALLWANVHGSFILFFVLVGLALLFGAGNRKQLFYAIAFALVFTLINPRGFALWGSVIGTFTSQGIRDLSPEWRPPVNEGWQMNMFFAWLILLAPLAAFAGRRLSPLFWALFLCFSWLAVSGTRYVIWDLFIVSILTAGLIPEWLANWFDQPQGVINPAVNFGLGMAFLLMPFMLLPGVREQWWQDGPPVIDPRTPVEATAWLADHPELAGSMWNDVVFGSYLIHALPSRPVWLDTRIQVIFTAEQAEEYFLVQSAEPGWDVFLAEQGVNLLVLAHTQPDLVSAASQSKEWCMQYQDEVAVIFSRCEPLP